MANNYILDIRDLHVYFRVYEGISRVIDGVSLNITRGERVGLVGETGCGKTVTIKAIMGILRIPPAIIPCGEIYLNDRNILRMSPNELLQIKGIEISMIFQDPMSALNPVFTVGEQFYDIIRFAQRRIGNEENLSRDRIRNKIIAALKEVKLPDPDRIANNYPLELSGGMRQRILIAMAMVNNPKLLIADEPGTALDVTIQAQILDLINNLVKTRGVSVLLVTHNLGVIRETTDRVYVMYGGQVMETAPTKILFKNPKHPYTQGLLSSVPRLTGGKFAEGITGTIPEYIQAPSGCRFHPRCSYAKTICSQKKPSFMKFENDHYVNCHLYRRQGDKNE
jgi:peptide/nickel transport system ATP-binding protein